MIDPRAVVPELVMPGYPFLAERELDYDDIAGSAEDQCAPSACPTPTR